MKKIYAFLAAALLSVSMFAAPAKVPTVADLAAAYDVQNSLVLAIYFDEEAAVCGDIVFVGNYRMNETGGWIEDPAELKKFEEVTGFDGWFAVEIPFSEFPEGDAQGKPVQLKEGAFSWDFQPGDVNSWIPLSDGLLADVRAGGYNPAESDVSYPSAGAYIYEIAYLKDHKSPCVFVPVHKYTINLYHPACSGADFKPAMAGNFNGWGFTAMNEGLDDFFETVYTLVVEDEEGHEFKFAELEGGWNNEIQWLNMDEIDQTTGEPGVWQNFSNFTLPVVSGDTTLIFDFSDPAKYRYAQCGGDMSEYTVSVVAKLPAGAPAAGVEIVGSFEGWAVAPVLMTVDAEGNYTAQVIAKESDEFKFREAGTWENQVIFVADGAELPNTKFGEVWADQDGAKVINIDFSDPTTYAWKVPSALENIKFDATEGIRKVVIDGSIYIIKGNAVYNVMGAQVR